MTNSKRAQRVDFRLADSSLARQRQKPDGSTPQEEAKLHASGENRNQVFPILMVSVTPFQFTPPRRPGTSVQRLL